MEKIIPELKVEFVCVCVCVRKKKIVSKLMYSF